MTRGFNPIAKSQALAGKTLKIIPSKKRKLLERAEKKGDE